MHLVPAVTAEPALLSPDWWSAFTRFTGFGGVAAVAAALVALLGTARRDASERDLARRGRAAVVADRASDRWWSMYRWLLEQPGRLRPDHAAAILHALDQQARTDDERQLVAAASLLFGTAAGRGATTRRDRR